MAEFPYRLFDPGIWTIIVWRAKLKPLATPFPTYTHTRRVNKNFCFLGRADWGITEISDTNKNVKEAGVMKLTSCQFHLPVWSVKVNGSWRMTVNYYKFNHYIWLTCINYKHLYQIITFINYYKRYSCPLICSIFTGANRYSPCHVVCSYWPNKCLILHANWQGPPEAICFYLAGPTIY